MSFQTRIDYQVPPVAYPLTYVCYHLLTLPNNVRRITIRLRAVSISISGNKQKNWLPDVMFPRKPCKGLADSRFLNQDFWQPYHIVHVQLQIQTKNDNKKMENTSRKDNWNCTIVDLNNIHVPHGLPSKLANSAGVCWISCAIQITLFSITFLCSTNSKFPLCYN